MMVGFLQIPITHVKICIHLLRYTIKPLHHQNKLRQQPFSHLIITMHLRHPHHSPQYILIDLPKPRIHIRVRGHLFMDTKQKPPDLLMFMNQKMVLGH